MAKISQKVFYPTAGGFSASQSSGTDELPTYRIDMGSISEQGLYEATIPAHNSKPALLIESNCPLSIVPKKDSKPLAGTDLSTSSSLDSGAGADTCKPGILSEGGRHPMVKRRHLSTKWSSTNGGHVETPSALSTGSYRSAADGEVADQHRKSGSANRVKIANAQFNKKGDILLSKSFLNSDSSKSSKSGFITLKYNKQIGGYVPVVDPADSSNNSNNYHQANSTNNHHAKINPGDSLTSPAASQDCCQRGLCGGGQIDLAHNTDFNNSCHPQSGGGGVAHTHTHPTSHPHPHTHLQMEGHHHADHNNSHGHGGLGHMGHMHGHPHHHATMGPHCCHPHQIGIKMMGPNGCAPPPKCQMAGVGTLMSNAVFECKDCGRTVPAIFGKMCHRTLCRSKSGCDQVFHCETDWLMHFATSHSAEFKEYQWCSLCQKPFPREHFQVRSLACGECRGPLY